MMDRMRRRRFGLAWTSDVFLSQQMFEQSEASDCYLGNSRRAASSSPRVQSHKLANSNPLSRYQELHSDQERKKILYQNGDSIREPEPRPHLGDLPYVQRTSITSEANTAVKDRMKTDDYTL